MKDPAIPIEIEPGATNDEALQKALIQGVVMGIPGFSVAVGTGEDLLPAVLQFRDR